MGNKRRERPQHLAEKLLAIRNTLGLSQSQLVKRIGFIKSGARVSEYEHGVREPDLIVLLQYARLAGVHMETLIDDRMDLTIPDRVLRKAAKR
jgi:transcriptional regulator with XRE-family HTH domain